MSEDTSRVQFTVTDIYHKVDSLNSQLVSLDTTLNIFVRVYEEQYKATLQRLDEQKTITENLNARLRKIENTKYLTPQSVYTFMTIAIALASVITTVVSSIIR